MQPSPIGLTANGPMVRVLVMAPPLPRRRRIARQNGTIPANSPRETFAF